MNGTSDYRVSTEWRSRPADQRFLSMDTLISATRRMRDCSGEVRVDPRSLAPVVNGGLAVTLDGQTYAGTHWSVSQMCGMLGVPRDYLARVPADLCERMLRHGLDEYHNGHALAYMATNGQGRGILRALTSTQYGRVYDAEVANWVQELTQRSEGRWKVPGTLNWSTGIQDAGTEVTPESTTLYASDRDMFVFLADDSRPIEIGTDEHGKPDLLFPAFYCWNSEVGSRTLGLSVMYLRGVCQNRILWGVDKRYDWSTRHVGGTRERFLREFVPILRGFLAHADSRVREGVERARAVEVCHDTDGALTVLRDVTGTLTAAQAVLAEQSRLRLPEPHTAWDITQAATAWARSIPYQDTRIAVERRAGQVLAKAAA